MFDDFGRPVLSVDILGTVRDAAGFGTGMRVQDSSVGHPRRTTTFGADLGLTLRQDRVFDRWNQPVNLTIKPIEPVFKPPEPIEPVFMAFDFQIKTRW
jgi:hypothetical protein